MGRFNILKLNFADITKYHTRKKAYILRLALSYLFLFLASLNAYAQPEPCNTGNEETCRCWSSPILCSIAELDGYSYSMSWYLHPENGPNGCGRMCPPPALANTTSHNPTWFRFPAWCEDLTLEVCWSNCTRNPNSCNSRGIQSAVYSECFGNCPDCLGPSWNCNQYTPPPYSYAVGCEVNSCGPTNGCATYSMTGLEFGKIYYFLVDGCCGSACDVEISVIGSCGFPEIQEFEEPIGGPEYACAGEAVVFTSGIAPGANTYFWYVDGELEGFGRQIPLTFEYTFDDPGEYEICITAFHNPCISEEDANREQCFTITVGDADAGTPIAEPTPVCPNGTVNLSVTDYIADFNQWLVVTDAAGVIVAVIEGDAGTYSFNGCANFTLYSVNSSPGTTPPNLSIGSTFNPNFCNNEDCCDIVGVPFEFSESGSIDWTDPPPDISVNCLDDVPDMENLDWVGACQGSGSATGVEDAGSYDECAVSTITRTWTVVDGCGDENDYIQTITIEPLLEAEFVDPPADTELTISCSDLADWSFPDLEITNGSQGDCEISSTLPPQISGEASICQGGILTALWSFEDQCERMISFTQVVTVEQIAPLEFIDPPADVTIECFELASYMIPDLQVTNGDNDDCEVDDIVSPDIDNEADECGGSITVVWSYTDLCGNEIEHTQVITVNPPESIAFIDPPDNITIECHELATLSIGDLSYTNEGMGACLFEGSVPPQESGSADVCGGSLTYTWEMTDDCGNFITHAQTIIVTPIEPPAFIDAPADITIDCTDLAAFSPVSLAYTNNGIGDCITIGTADPVETGSADECGGTLTYTWQVTDICNNVVTHVQNVTVEPLPTPEFIDPPADIEITCHELDGFNPVSLNYSNSSSGSCLEEGSIDPEESGEASICGGTLSYTWEYTDQCNTTITHVQNVTVTPLEAPEFIDPPASVTIECHELENVMPLSLSYTNNGIDECLTEGSVDPEESGDASICGGSIVFEWEFTDECNNTITHIQEITVTPLEAPEFIDPPASVTIECHELENVMPLALSYTNNGIDECLTEGSVDPEESGDASICGGSIVFEWEFTDECNNTITHIQEITVTPLEAPEFIDPPASVTIECHELENVMPLSLSYTNNGIDECLTEGSVDPEESGDASICGGSIVFEWEFTDECNNTITHIQEITVTPLEAPEFIDPPASVTIECHELENVMPLSLSYTNNGIDECLTEGSVDPEESGDASICGGSIVFEWEFTDECNNTITHIQEITVTPLEAPEFIDPPASVTIECHELENVMPLSLSYTNNGIDECFTEGSVDPEESGDASICGGSIVFEWEFTDECNNTITHIQEITVTPLEAPEFIDPPADEVTECENIPTSAPELEYSNNGIDECLVNGTVEAVQIGESDLCGGQFRFEWEFTDECNNTITHSQVVIVNPVPAPEFEDLPADVVVDCDALITDPAPLNYNNGLEGDCLLEGTANGVLQSNPNVCGGDYQILWEATDECGNVISHSQTVTVNPAPPIEFIDPPADMNVNCDEIPAAVPNLNYTNNAGGSCLFTGSVAAVQLEQADICGGVAVYQWTATDQCNNQITHTQTFTVSPAAEPVLLNTPSPSITIPCNAVPPSPPVLQYSNNDPACLISGSITPTISGGFDQCGGEIVYIWEGTTQCGYDLFFQQTITVLPAPQAIFQNLPPASIDISCAEALQAAPTLTYTNNLSGQCAISGTSNAQVSNNYNVCGGTITRTWSFTDVCGRNTSYVQNVTVGASPEPQWQNPPPASITLNCSQVPPNPPTLNYSNNQPGLCLISGTETAIQSGSFNACGGNLTNTFTFTDVCNRTINYVQSVEVLAAPAPQFTDLPADVTLACNGVMIPPTPLPYTNNATGPCEVFGSSFPDIEVDGIVTTYTWSFINNCTGQQVTHSQSITRPWIPLVFGEPLQLYACGDNPVDLSDVIVTESQGRDVILTYHNGAPPGPWNEIPDPVVFPTEYTIYYIMASNEFGCSDFVIVEVFVLPGSDAGEDGNGTACRNGAPVNLFNFLGGTPEMGGNWVQLTGQPVNISNPQSVLFNVNAGNYIFRYEVGDGIECPIETSFVTVQVINPPNIQLIERICDLSGEEYSVVINSTNLTVTANVGVLTDNGDNTVTISGIPITENVTVSVVHNTTGCENSLQINAPDCSCPNVPAPISGGDLEICFGDEVPELTVSPVNDEIINWYNAATGGDLLASDTNEYTPDETEVGTYIYYVEAVDAENPNCVSDSRTPVELTINSLPSANPATLELCDVNSNGFASFNLTGANTQINSGSGLVFTYYLTEMDAENNVNPITSPFTNTVPYNQEIFAVVTDDEGCRSITNISLIVNELPEVDLDITGLSCPGANDGSVIVNAQGGTGGYQYRLNMAPFGSNNVFENLQAINYNVSVRDQKNCTVTAAFSIPQGRVMTIAGFSAQCDNNDTSTDPDDDFYSFSWTMNNNQGNTGSYTVFIGGVAQGTFNYGELASISPFPANGSTIQLVFIDDEFACEITRTTNALEPCSSDCEITITDFSLECNDNGTPTNPNDDFYIVFVNAAAVNGGTSNMFTVTVDGVVRGSFMYGVGGTFNLTANGMARNLVVNDNQFTFCSDEIQTPELTTCSDQCLISILTLTRNCDNNGTTSDDTDDFYFFTFNATKLNGPIGSGTYDVIIDGNVVGTFSYDEVVNFQYPATGQNETLIIRDSDDSDCTASTTTGVLRTCSTECVIEITSITTTCNNAGTPADPSDDFYVISFVANAINGSSDFSYTVTADGVEVGVFTYGLGGNFQLPAEGQIVTLVFTDNEDESCFVSREIGPLNTCSDQCVITGEITNIICDNAGTEEDDADDLFFFDLTVTGVNNSTQWRIIANNFTSDYGVTETFGPFLISGGNITYTIQDVVRTNCTTTVTAVAPPVCSEACEMVVTDINIGDCDDNGTGNTDADDFFRVSFRVDTDYSESTTFIVLVGTDQFGPFDYGATVTLDNLAADGNPIVIIIRDELVDICNTQISISQNPCSSCEQTISTEDTDILTCEITEVSLVVNASEPGATFRWTGPNNFEMFGQTVITNNPGLYIVQATFPDQCTVIDSVRVMADESLPNAVLGSNQVLTCEINQVTLDGSMSSQGPDFRYEWRNAAGLIISTDLQVTVSDTGRYFFRVINTVTECESQDASIRVLENRVAPLAVIYANPSDVLDCVIREITLTTDEQNNVIYIWRINDIAFEGNEAIASEPGVILLTAIDTINGCDNFTELVIEDLEEYPIIQVNDPDPITCQTLSVVIDGSASQSGNNIVYNWYDSMGQLIETGVTSITVSAAGEYILELVDVNNGCTNDRTIVVEEETNFPDVDISSAFELPCDDDSGSISASIDIPINQALISWSSVGGTIVANSNTLNPSIRGSGVYTISVIDTETGCETTATTNVVLADAPEVSGYAIQPIECFGDNNAVISVEAVEGGLPPYRYLINGQPSNTPVFSNLTPGTYNIQIIDAKDCVIDTTIIIAEGDRLDIILAPELRLLYGEIGVFEAIVNLPEDQIGSIQWVPADHLSNPDQLITEVTAISPGNYTITITSLSGCIASRSIRLVVERDIKVVLPNIFNPNSGGNNGFFTVYSNDEIESVSKMFIYDRWGELVFAKENFLPNVPTEGWDGRFKGRDVVPGVYVYVVELVIKDGNGQTQVVTGDVTVVR
jgi:gliding motility-associated-like protein